MTKLIFDDGNGPVTRDGPTEPPASRVTPSAERSKRYRALMDDLVSSGAIKGPMAITPSADYARESSIRRSFPQHLVRVFLVQFVDDTFIGKTHELGERRLRPAGSARQCRNEAGQRRERVPVDRPKIDIRVPQGLYRGITSEAQ